MAHRIVFMGSPEFAVPTLSRLAQSHEVVGVVTQPDRPAGRGQVLTPSPVKLLAMDLGLPLIQPVRLRQPEVMHQLMTWAPDLIVVAAFGQILRPQVLDLPPLGCVNVHASLLPRWRGAAPINAAILHGDPQTGVTIMRMDPGVDTGPILSQRAEPILPDDTTPVLSERLSVLGADLLLETLPGYILGDLQPQTQADNLATYAPMLKKEDGLLDFTQTAAQLERCVRAFQPWPGVYLEWSGGTLKILHATTSDALFDLPPGQRLVYQGMPAIRTIDGLLVFDEVQPAGKKSMPGKVFLQGARNWA